MYLYVNAHLYVCMCVCCCSSKPVAWYLLGEQTRIVPSHLFYSLKRNNTRSYERKRTIDTENIDSPFVYAHNSYIFRSSNAILKCSKSDQASRQPQPNSIHITRERESELKHWERIPLRNYEFACLSAIVPHSYKETVYTHTHTRNVWRVSVLPATGAIWCATYVSLTYTYACTYIKYNHRYSGRCRTLMIMMCICFSASGTISATRLDALRADSDPIRKGTWNKTEAKVFQLHLSIETKESSSKWYVVY